MLDSITLVPSWFVSDLVTMLNIATEHANMISLFSIRFLDSITNVSESKF